MAEGQSGGGGLRKFFNNTLGGIQDKLQTTGASTFYEVSIVHQSSQGGVKKGWLKKQGGVIRSWHRRWFHLKEDQLHYYTAPDESKLQGSIWLPGNNVIEHALSSTKPDEFLFEIIPAGDKVKASQSHDTYLICACSDDERKSWVSALKRVMFAQQGGAIFGSSLRATLQNEIKLRGSHKIPEIVQMCAAFVLQHGRDTEGVFRLPGRASLIRELKEKFDVGQRPELRTEEHDVPTVASLLKQYLRDLPEPLIPKHFYEAVMKVVNREMPLDPDEGVVKLRDIICEIPAENYNTLQYLCNLLNQVASHHDVNKMTHMNLATVFVHSVIRPEDEDPALLMGTANSRTQCTFFLMVKADEIFTLNYEAEETTPTEDLLNMVPDDTGFETGVEALEISETISPTPTSENEVGSDYVHVRSVPSPTADDLLGFHDNHFATTGGLPNPLTPNTVESDNALNRRGSRKGRVFPVDLTYGDDMDVDTPVYIDSDQLASDNFRSRDMSPGSDPGYETIEDIHSRNTQHSRHPGSSPEGKNAPSDSTQDRSLTENGTATEQSQEQDAGYSHLVNYSSLPQGPRECIDDDNYSYLPDQRPILRRKPSRDRDLSGGKARGSHTTSAAPKLPPKPRPRTSLGRSRSSCDDADKDKDSIYSIPFDSITESERQLELRERSSRLVSQDLDLLGSREQLVAHIEQLHGVVGAQARELAQLRGALHREKRQHEEALKEKEEQVVAEREATSEAVNRVVALQTDLQRYITKYGSIICDT